MLATVERPVRPRHYRDSDLIEHVTGQTKDRMLERHVDTCRICRVIAQNLKAIEKEIEEVLRKE